MLKVHELKILRHHAQLVILRQPLLLYRAPGIHESLPFKLGFGLPKQSPDPWEEWSGDSQ